MGNILKSTKLNQFFSLRSNFHLIDNSSIPRDNTNKFIKVRPIYEAINNKIKSIPKERNLSVDEQIISFKGHLQMKQYVKGKPCPWGIKAFLLCGSCGMVYNIILYQSNTTDIDQNILKTFGLGASVVLHLTKYVEKNKHLNN